LKFIDFQITRHPRGMAERESATCADIIDDFCNSSIFTTKFTTKWSA